MTRFEMPCFQTGTRATIASWLYQLASKKNQYLSSPRERNHSNQLSSMTFYDLYFLEYKTLVAFCVLISVEPEFVN